MKKSIVLETSSYLPLLWRTPYSSSTIETMAEHADTCEYLLQRDCLREAAGYLSFEDDWRYHPAVRFRRLAERLSESELGGLPFPSSAVQLLLGGSIWPQAQYLNFVRHTAFFFIDLLDAVSFDQPRHALIECASRIEERVRMFRDLFQRHELSSEVYLPQQDMLSYWGSWYLQVPKKPFRIRVVDDPRPYNLATDKLRDAYHYECAMSFAPSLTFVLVANTGFVRNIKNSFKSMPCPVVCAKTASRALFAD